MSTSSISSTQTSGSSSNPATPVLLPSYSLPEQLNGANYIIWCTMIESFLDAAHLLPVVDGSKPEPPTHLLTLAASSSTTDPRLTVSIPNPAYVSWRTRDRTAMGWLLTTSTLAVVAQLTALKSSAAIWRFLAATYSAQSTAKAASLRLELQSMCRGDRTVAEYLQRTTHIADQLALIGEPLHDSEYTSHVFRGLGSEFQSLAVAISVTSSVSPISREDLHGLLLSHKSMVDLAARDAVAAPPVATFVAHGSPSQSAAPPSRFLAPVAPLLPSMASLQVSSGGRGQRRRVPFCQICRRKGHSALTCRDQFNLVVVYQPPNPHSPHPSSAHSQSPQPGPYYPSAQPSPPHPAQAHFTQPTPFPFPSHPSAHLSSAPNPLLPPLLSPHLLS